MNPQSTQESEQQSPEAQRLHQSGRTSQAATDNWDAVTFIVADEVGLALQIFRSVPAPLLTRFIGRAFLTTLIQP
jgi:hypothetical protein